MMHMRRARCCRARVPVRTGGMGRALADPVIAFESQAVWAEWLTGLREIEQARADGRWDAAYDGVTVTGSGRR